MTTTDQPQTGLGSVLQASRRVFIKDNDGEYVHVGGTDYHRLASHPEVIDALKKGSEISGISAGGSRVTTGNHPVYLELEQLLANFFKVPSVLTIGSGYLSNWAVLQSIDIESYHVLVDEKSHASMKDAIRLMAKDLTYFSTGDLNFINDFQKNNKKILLLTDHVFSMSGEISPISEYLSILSDESLLIVDDSHGMGVLGIYGEGACFYNSAILNDKLIVTGTLSKAFGCYGGVILATKNRVQAIIQKSSIFMASTALPIPLAYAVIKSVNLLHQNPQWVERLQFESRRFKAQLAEKSSSVFCSTVNSSPIIICNHLTAKDCAFLSHELKQAGFFPPQITYPTIQSDGSCLIESVFRFALSSQHSDEMILNLGSILQSVSLQKIHNFKNNRL